MISPPFSPLDRRDFLGLGLSGLALAASPAFAQVASDPKPKIATIGAGRQGGALGTLFAKAGFQVMFSALDPDALKDLVAAAGPNTQAGTTAQAVAFGDVILIAVPYSAMEQIGRDFGSGLATKQLVLDISNPVAGRDGADLVKKINDEGGAGLAAAKILPGARIVRAFNAINYAALTRAAHRSGAPLGVPIAGDDQKANALASRLIKEIGFEPVLIGGLAKGKYLVPGTAIGGEHTPDELRKIAAGLT